MPGRIYDPKGNTVIVEYNDEYDQSMIDSITAYWETKYPNATLISPASAQYNCYGYTFWVSEGGEKCWIDYPNWQQFINDGSYVSVSSQADGEKVVYPNGDNSAVTTSTNNVFISKWADGPLMEHAYDYCPFDASDLAYYKRYDLVVGVEDYIFVYAGPATITQNSESIYSYNFVDEYPHGDYLVNSSSSLLIEHGEGEYVAATSVAYPGAPGYEAIFEVRTLPYGYYWLRDASGNVKGQVKVEGTDEEGYDHTTYYDIAMTGVPKNTTSGSLSHDETWGNQNVLTGSVTVPSGITLTILPNSTVEFPSGASLTVSGSLIAIGTHVSPIKFTSTGSTSPGAWGSIVLNGSGANGSTIAYANIQYGTGMDIINANNATIQNCNITNTLQGINFSGSTGSAIGNHVSNASSRGMMNNGYDGIIVQNGSNVTCNQNTVKRTNGNYWNAAGILYNGGSNGSIWQNDVNGWQWGVYANSSSSPIFRNENNIGRNNRITNCQTGVEADNNSNPTICIPAVSGASGCYSGNSIYGNSYCNVNNTTAIKLYAEVTYWGSSTKFYGNVDYTNSLSTDPWSGIPLPSVQSAPDKGGVKAGNVLASIAQSEGVNDPAGADVVTAGGAPALTDSLVIGMDLLDQHKNGDAKDFFLAYLNRHPDDQAGYVDLYNCADSATTPVIIQYFKSLPIQAAKDHKLLLSYLYLKQGDTKSATQNNNSIISANANTALALRAKLNNFFIALYNDDDPRTASSILGDVVSKKGLLTPIDLSLAENALATYVDPKTGEMPDANYGSQQSTAGAQQMPDGLSENYPNPFNPSTNIGYNLSRSGHVTLKVYDILGREVTTLVNENESAGYHTAVFDASRLASGVYLYRLTAPGITQVKKMVVTK